MSKNSQKKKEKRKKKKENLHVQENKNTTTNNEVEKSNLLINIYWILTFVFGGYIIILLCNVFLCYYNDSNLPPLLLNGYFTITFSILSFFISCYIYGKQDEPNTEKEKAISVTTLLTILISILFIVKDVLVINEITIFHKFLYIIAILIIFIFTIAVRLFNISVRNIRNSLIGCIKRFKDHFSPSR
ncbi:hypothetical protein ACJ8VI_002741 [Providencia stuartii]|uniref:hypothetical protein n=1 Tax=Providencia stuartii TaxID=588 RepID=UPI00370B9587